MPIKKDIEEFFDNNIADIKSDQVGKGIRASGESADSLNKTTNDDGGQLKGSRYITQQVEGRRPGAMPPVEDILAWIKVKGIQSDIKPEQLAWAIAKKIAKSGTDIFQGKREGLDLKNIIDKNKETLKKRILRGTVLEIKSAIQSTRIK
jgi:hypothetical protein